MFQLISVGKRALQVTEKQIETTSNNISNINTPGYSRQRVIQESNYPIELAYANIGTGVNIQSIERLRDTYLDVEYRGVQTEFGYWDKRSDLMSKVETILNEPSEYGLSNKIDSFFAAWDSLASNPNSYTHRIDLVSKTNDMTDGFNNLSAGLLEQRKAVNNEIANTVNRVNQIAEEISDLLVTIYNSEKEGKTANDLRDKFDLLIDELSKYGDVCVKKKEYGQTSVYFGTDVLAEGATFRKMGVESVKDGDIDVNNVVWADNGDNINGLRSGEILGLIDLRDNVIKSYMNQLDQIAMTIAKEVNAVHKNGYDVASENERGHLFFDEKLTGAKDFKLNKIIQDDPGKIATSLTGAVGDNQTALNIANLKFSKLINNDTSIVQSYSNLVYDIGKDVAYMKSKQENMELTVNQVNKFREAVKGVSLNEETADLIKYQQMYQAAAKIISVADDMFKVVLGLV